MTSSCSEYWWKCSECSSTCSCTESVTGFIRSEWRRVDGVLMLSFYCSRTLWSVICFISRPWSDGPSDVPAPIGAEEGLDCVRGATRRTPGTQSHRTQGHRCQDLGKELQGCYCWSKRNLEQTNDKEFQPALPFTSNWSYCRKKTKIAFLLIKSELLLRSI